MDRARIVALVVAALCLGSMWGGAGPATAQSSPTATVPAVVTLPTATPTSLPLNTDFSIEAVRVEPFNAPLRWRPNAQSLHSVQPNQRVRLTTFIFVSSLPHPSALDGTVTLSMAGNLWVSFPIHETLPAGQIDTRIRYAYFVRLNFPGTYTVTASFTANGVQKTMTQTFTVVPTFTPQVQISPNPAVAGQKVVAWVSSSFWPSKSRVFFDMQAGGRDVRKKGGWKVNCRCFVTYTNLPRSVSGKGALHVTATIVAKKQTYHASAAFDIKSG